ncbi:MAG: EamA family transporter [Acidobacteria bacterium]|nr:EamA family transporter [Acidobacteriota bacterium]
MLGATLLAIGAAVLHAGWNFAIKQSGDRWLALWGQFFVAGIGCVMLVFGLGGVPAVAWGWAVVSGLIHVAYAWFLARAYDIGEFSVTYPMARGCGAVLAAIGGVVLLGDTLSTTKVVGVGITAIGLWMIAGPADGAHVRVALAVASTICMYTIVDSHGSRATGGYLYPLAAITTFGALTTLHGIALGRRRDMIAAFRINWLRFAITGAASFVTYWMVLVAVQHASVGYVTALRESSVVLAALVGVFVLKEPNAKRRITAACIAVAGLAILVAG